MSLPNVNVNLANGALGTVDTTTGLVAGMLLTGVAATGLTLGVPKAIYSLQDAIDLGITQTLNPFAFKHIKEFYDGYLYIANKAVAELWIMLVPNTMTLTQQADQTNAAGAYKLLTGANGRIRILGLTFSPSGTYTGNVDDGVDADCLTALAKAHALGEYSFTNDQSPVRVLIEGRSFAIANQGDLKDLSTYEYPRAGIVLCGSSAAGSSVGFALGVKAALPRQRKISRVRNGAIGWDAAYIGDTKVDNVTDIGNIHDKGYITMRTIVGKSGYFFSGEPMATAKTDDYYLLSRGCVIDGATVIAYNTFTNELDDDVEVDPVTGLLPQGYISTLESNINTAIKNGMPGEISGDPKFTIDPGQNFLATNKTKVKLKVIPKGYQSEIDIDLGFYNPLVG